MDKTDFHAYDKYDGFHAVPRQTLSIGSGRGDSYVMG